MRKQTALEIQQIRDAADRTILRLLALEFHHLDQHERGIKLLAVVNVPGCESHFPYTISWATQILNEEQPQ